jgi:hypothetical protein
LSDPFFDHPILNSPYDYPRRHWELDEAGQPTQKIVDNRRGAKFITPIPKPKKRKTAAQTGFVFDEGKGLSTKEQQYDDADLQEVYDTERHLLYVACTRARDHLLVTGLAPVSEFLDDFVKGNQGRATQR